MRLFSSLAAAAALCATTGLLAPDAKAATMDFVVDLDNSDVTVTETGGGGLACFLSNCGVQADLALVDGATYTLGTGDVATFDFLTFFGDGTTGLTPRRFDITAVLAFSSPSLAVTGEGSGSAFLVAGYILAGVLTWTSITPSPWIAENGSEISFLFQDGKGIFLGNEVTTSASIIGTSIVPLPAGGLLLIGALAGLAALRRKRVA